jgi:hypothetical protein
MDLFLSQTQQDALLKRLATLETAEKDAARYRWLRDNCGTHDVAARVCLELPGNQWDAAIDEAMEFSA